MDSKLEAFEMWAYRRMLRVSWTEHKTTGSAISKYEHRQTSALLRNIRNIRICIEKKIFKPLYTGAPNGSVPQNICSSGTFLLAGRCGRNTSPWKESVAGKR